MRGSKNNLDNAVALFWAHLGKIVAHFGANLLVTLVSPSPASPKQKPNIYFSLVLFFKKFDFVKFIVFLVLANIWKVLWHILIHALSFSNLTEEDRFRAWLRCLHSFGFEEQQEIVGEWVIKIYFCWSSQNRLTCLKPDPLSQTIRY